MDKEMVIDLVTEQMARIRKEKNYTQDRMTEVLGLSKRHLQEVEKIGRASTGRKLRPYVHYSGIVTF